MITKIDFYRSVLIAVALAAPMAAPAQDEEDGPEEWVPANVMGRASFVVEEFVPNRVKIEAQAEERRFGLDDPVQVTVKAEEMFGQPIVNQPVSGYVTWSAKPFKPEQWEGYTFGDSERRFDGSSDSLPEQYLAEDGQTSMAVAPPDARPPAALEAEIQVTVTDGGRGVTRSLKRIVDPLKYYLGIKSQEDTYATPGKATSFTIVAVNPAGEVQAVDTLLTGTIFSERWNSNLVRSNGSYTFETNRELVKLQETSVSLTGGRGSVAWEPKSVGSYMIQLGDTSSSASVSQKFYVSGSDWDRQPWSLEKPEAAELVLDKDKYMVGETARLLIKAPFPGTVLLTLEQDRVVSTTVLAMPENTLEVPITVTENMLPNVYAVASIIRPVKPAPQWLPHRAIGMVNLPVTADSRVIDVAVTAPLEVRPNSELVVTAELRDKVTSAPVSGDVILWAVDEGVLSLTSFKTPAPGKFFEASRRLMVETADFFSNLMPEIIESATAASGTGGGDGLGQRLSPVPSERVKPVVLWQGPARADASGRVEVRWQVPQFMGRLRVMAMAAEGKRFGSGDTDVFVRNPIMLKEHLPRFAAPGDQFTAGMTVYNNTDAPMEPTVAAGSQAELLTVEPATSETLPAVAPRGQATVYREISVAQDQFGQAPVTMAAQAGAENYETSVTLPVRPASPRITLSEAVAVKPGKSQTLQIPGADFLPQSTSVTLVAGGSPNLALAGALQYNVRYPYGCTEQVVSSVFPLLYLGDLAKLTEPEAFSDEGLRFVVQAGIDRVLMAQASVGALAMWIGYRTEWDWATIYGAHFLVEARRAGYEVNQEYLNAMLDYLQSLVTGTVENVPKDELTRRAYACYVMARAGRQVHQRMEQLHPVRDKMSHEGRALLAAGYLQSGLADDAREIMEAASPLPVVDVTSVTRQTGGILTSPIRETAIMLMTWVDIDPNATETASLAQRLLNLRKGGRWGTTQENGFALVALGSYAKKLADAPPVTGRVRVGGDVYEFSTSEPLRLTQAELAGAKAVIESKSGTAHVAYSAEGVPVAPPPDAESNGITLTRRFLNREGDEVQPTELKQGQLVVVELELTGNRELDNVVLQDLLPAGLEVENPRLASSEDAEATDDIAGFSVERMDVRDDRVLVFGDLMKTDDNIQRYRYTARAVTPGDFVLPPALFEVMYDPAVSARTAPGRVSIEKRQ